VGATCRLAGRAGALATWDVAQKDLVTVERAEIRGDDLVLGVSYTGDCAAHALDLCWGVSFEKSEPPRVRLSLVHDAHGDSCKAIVDEERRHSLAVRGGTGHPELVLVLADQELPYAPK